MSDYAVMTICVGEETKKLSAITHPTIRKYAEKIGADFVVIDERKISQKFIHYEKFQIYDYLLKYKRIVFVDTDLIIRPDCPNLLEMVPEHCFGALNEGLFIDAIEIMKDACKWYKISIQKWDRQYYNTGVFVVSRLHRPVFIKPEDEHDVYGEGKHYHYEQPYLNAMILSNEYKQFDIGYKMNRVSMMDGLTGEDRKSSYIIHYAGGASFENRMSMATEDIFSWAQTAPEYFYPKRIQINLGGGIGDQIDSEPVVRYIKNVVYPKDNIRVITHFPVIMKHLDVEVIRAGDRYNGGVYYKMDALPGPEKPMWQFVSQTLCHTTDFVSMACLRRILQDKDKQINLKVDDISLKRLENIVPVDDVKNLVLVHPGKGFESKTFPSAFWQAVIDKVSEKHAVAVIGKYVSEEQGLIDVVCRDDVLDLRNMLSLEETIALISLSKVLISNDSAPVHIAGAFDNWIVLIPSCKHPDHVLPYRNGSKGYKTVALYKKLTCDRIDSSPTQVYGQTIDYVVGDIMDYLPEIDLVASTVDGIF